MVKAGEIPAPKAAHGGGVPPNVALRNKIKQIITTNPGLTIQQIAKLANVPHEGAYPNIAAMEKEGTILPVKRGRPHPFHPANTNKSLNCLKTHHLQCYKYHSKSSERLQE
ncbi:MAG TPA: hypothetical protein HA254_03095 [Candidatus Diapherotrites archaeon]|uniref:Uncharacterized protein n=1 Tax=Candidatus Iainarchaeum sp. TaxID=3101447 RepID=A0A7J4IXQ9_9ARCH|nr:hypothetical protein [Candidatus Diapherotrites archaeon]